MDMTKMLWKVETKFFFGNKFLVLHTLRCWLARCAFHFFFFCDNVSAQKIKKYDWFNADQFGWIIYITPLMISVNFLFNNNLLAHPSMIFFVFAKSCFKVEHISFCRPAACRRYHFFLNYIFLYDLLNYTYCILEYSDHMARLYPSKVTASK